MCSSKPKVTYTTTEVKQAAPVAAPAPAPVQSENAGESVKEQQKRKAKGKKGLLINTDKQKNTLGASGGLNV